LYFSRLIRPAICGMECSPFDAFRHRSRVDLTIVGAHGEMGTVR